MLKLFDRKKVREQRLELTALQSLKLYSSQQKIPFRVWLKTDGTFVSQKTIVSSSTTAAVSHVAATDFVIDCQEEGTEPVSKALVTPNVQWYMGGVYLS